MFGYTKKAKSVLLQFARMSWHISYETKAVGVLMYKWMYTHMYTSPPSIVFYILFLYLEISTCKHTKYINAVLLEGL